MAFNVAEPISLEEIEQCAARIALYSKDARAVANALVALSVLELRKSIITVSDDLRRAIHAVAGAVEGP
jgi:hypothetical protein